MSLLSLLWNSTGVLFPFDASVGSGQSATLTLADTTTVSVSYDESTEEIAISGQGYSDGDSFVLDGKKVTLFYLI